MSPDGAWRVDILPSEDLRNKRSLDAFVGEIEAIFPDLTGGAYQSRKAGEIISNAMLQATLIALAVVSLFLWLLVRRFRIVLMIILPLALAAGAHCGDGRHIEHAV